MGAHPDTQSEVQPKVPGPVTGRVTATSPPILRLSNPRTHDSGTGILGSPVACVAESSFGHTESLPKKIPVENAT